jgi:hypothetical protein
MSWLISNSTEERLLESACILPTHPEMSTVRSISSLGFLPTPPRGNYRCTPKVYFSKHPAKYPNISKKKQFFDLFFFFEPGDINPSRV